MRTFLRTVLLCVATSADYCAFGRAAEVALHADLRVALADEVAAWVEEQKKLSPTPTTAGAVP